MSTTRVTARTPIARDQLVVVDLVTREAWPCQTGSRTLNAGREVLATALEDLEADQVGQVEVVPRAT